MRVRLRRSSAGAPCVPVLALAGLLLAISPASAATFTYVDAGRGEALFETGAGTLTITLTDLVVNPGGVADNISGLGFTIDDPSAGALLTSQTGVLRQVFGGAPATNGTYTDLAGGVEQTLYWNFDATTLFLSALGTARPGGKPPDETILGSPADWYPSARPGAGKYNGGGSINGNGPHNPFVDTQAIFILSIPGVTSDTLVTSAVFRFGTEAADGFESGDCVSGCSPGTPGTADDTTVPEPASLLLLGSGLITGASMLRRRPAK